MTDAIFKFVDHVAGAVDGSQFTVCIFCHLFNAFDSVSVEKLRYYVMEWLGLLLAG